MPIVHSLVVGPETRLEDVGVVLSHPQPLLQCRGYLERELPGVRTEAALSTAEAVERIVVRGDAAAIAPRRAADLHGGVVLEEGIEDDHRNATRFVVLTTQDAEPSGDDKTSLMFSVRDEPGALVRILQSFAEAGVNLTKIESRPAREALGVYIFLVDCDGHRAQPPLREILEQLRPQTSELKVFGSYPRFQE